MPQCIDMEEDGVAVDKKTGVVLCSLFAIVLYLNTLSAEFAYDDKLECDLFVVIESILVANRTARYHSDRTYSN